jgi:hypothetical protein
MSEAALFSRKLASLLILTFFIYYFIGSRSKSASGSGTAPNAFRFRFYRFYEGTVPAFRFQNKDENNQFSVGNSGTRRSTQLKIFVCLGIRHPGLSEKPFFGSRRSRPKTRVADPDWIQIQSGQWIQIRPGSKRAKMTNKSKKKIFEVLDGLF